VQLLPNPGLLPLAQPPPAGHSRAIAELGRQVAPGDSGVQDEEDSVQRRPVIEAFSTRISVPTLDYGQKRLQLGPQAVVYLKA
jgi:hypothetical protein